MLLRYFASLSVGRIVLWCYLIWYLVTVVNYFDPTPAIWLNSLGISAVIGVALLLSVSGQGPRAGEPRRGNPWQTFRLFLMPFCVSSFSSLIKGEGYVLIVPPRPAEQAVGVALCLAFVLGVVTLKQLRKLRRRAVPA